LPWSASRRGNWDRRVKRLPHLVEQLLRWRYGPSRERVDENQLFLFAAGMMASDRHIQTGPVEFMKEFNGYLQADAYSAYDVLPKSPEGQAITCTLSNWKAPQNTAQNPHHLIPPSLPKSVPDPMCVHRTVTPIEVPEQPCHSGAGGERFAKLYTMGLPKIPGNASGHGFEHSP